MTTEELILLLELNGWKRSNFRGDYWYKKDNRDIVIMLNDNKPDMRYYIKQLFQCIADLSVIKKDGNSLFMGISNYEVKL